MLSIRKARNADEKIKADNIARSKATMARQAIKASATATCIPDEIAARKSERSSERKRIQDAQTATDAATEEDSAMIAYVLAATDEEEKRGRELCARSRQCSITSVARTIDVEESPNSRPKRRRGGNEKDKQSEEEDIHDDLKSIESEPVPVRESSRTTRVQTFMEVDLESGEEEGDEGYNDNDDNDDNDDDDDNVKDAESISDNDNQSSDESVESASPNKRKTKSPPRQIKKISTRKKITVSSRTKKSGQPKSASAKESKEDVDKRPSLLLSLNQRHLRLQASS